MYASTLVSGKGHRASILIMHNLNFKIWVFAMFSSTLADRIKLISIK
jgi:hypothetical protein